MSGLRRIIGHPDADRSDHFRARLIAAARLDEPATPDDEAWLAAHLEGCSRCRDDVSALESDRAAVRMLPPIASPRDLWARTAAALDREDARHGVRPAPPATPGSVPAGRRGSSKPAPRGALLGGLAIVLVVGLVGGTALTGLIAGGPSASPGIAAGSGDPRPTPFALAAGPAAWVTTDKDGSYVLNAAAVSEVCPSGTADCAHLGAQSRTVFKSTKRPKSVIVSSGGKQAIVFDQPDSVTGGSVSVLLLPVALPTPDPTESPAPTAPPTVTAPPATPAPPATTAPSASPEGTAAPPSPSSEPSASPELSPSPTPAETPGTGPSADPGESPAPSESPAGSEPPSSGAPSGSAEPTSPGASDPPSPSDSPVSSQEPPASAEPTPDPTATPPSTVPPPADPTGPSSSPAVARTLAILEGVVVVGDAAAFSPDNRWFAFSARPIDGSRGPDVYVWRVGDESGARQATNDHRSIFASWAGNQLLVSSPDLEGLDAGATTAPPLSRLVDPSTGRSRRLEQGAMWAPAVDPTRHLVAYWSGTVVLDKETRTWQPQDGQLYLADWRSVAGTLGAGARPRPERPVRLLTADDPVGAWTARWDSDGERLAVWIASRGETEAGTLSLLAVDAEHGTIDRTNALLLDAPALGGFSMGRDRLVWASPKGSGTDAGRVLVLAWSGAQAGRIYADPSAGDALVTVVR